jgi:hypothetical protein
MEISTEYIILGVSLFTFIGLPVVIYCIKCCCKTNEYTILENTSLRQSKIIQI